MKVINLPQARSWGRGGGGGGLTRWRMNGIAVEFVG